MEYQWPVALRPSSNPAAASVSEPLQMETIFAPFVYWVLIQAMTAGLSRGSIAGTTT
jgi:hypothetical protein